MRKDRRGFTLIELLLAIVILVIVATTFARFAGDFTRSIGNSSIRTIAIGVATGRLELVRADPRYSRLVSLYNSGAGADTTGFPNYPRMRRKTTVVRDQSGDRDRTTITVRVWDPAFSDTIAVTAIVASPE
jgi:prepilin-type N-terminal cleavage/methylation domain-containing protein